MTSTAGAKQTALAALAAGLCPFPPMEDGSKRPMAKWKDYQDRPPTRDELDRWYSRERTGVGTLCGKVSGNLEMLEWETREVAVDPGSWTGVLG